MGPSSSREEQPTTLPGIGQALAGLSNGPGSNSMLSGLGKNELINKYKNYDGKKYK